MSSWLIPAIFAALIAIGITLAIEHFGGKRGGLIGTLPSTIVPAALGLSTASTSIIDFQDALRMTPAGMLINALFLLCWRELPPFLPRFGSRLRLGICTVISLLLWLGMATLSVWIFPAAKTIGIHASELSLFLLILGIALGIAACLKNPPAPKVKAKVGPIAILSRGLLAGFAIGVSIWLASNSGPLIAGVAAVFPAMFLTTMFTLWIAHGEHVGAGAVGPMMLGGTSVSAFALIATWSMPTFGGPWGAAFAWGVSVVIITVPAWAWLNRIAVPMQSTNQ